jgi:type IV pilus assembly protein PilB
MTEQKFQNITEILHAQGKIDDETYETIVLESQKGPYSVDQITQKKKIVDSEDFTKAKGELLHFPYVDLREFQVEREVLDFFPEEIVAHHQVIAFKKENQVLQIAMVNPASLEASESVYFMCEQKGLTPKIFVTSPESFYVAYKKFSTLSSEVHRALGTVQKETLSTEKPSAEKIETIIEEAPVSKAVDVILKNAAEMRASDIHLEPSETNLRIRYRVDGVLRTALSLPINTHGSIVSRIKILSNLKIDEQRIPQDGRFHAEVSNKDLDLRVSTFPTTNGEKVVIRILDKTAGVLTLEDLGFSGRGKKIIEENIKKPFGLILLTGPTGSGKSTTSYSILNILNQEDVNIVTLEDPVEYFLPGVSQSQIRPQIGYTFASGLRSILRQDPNVIMVGEIRDSETAGLAIHAALTGHVVISTLHTNNAIGAIPRLIDMGIEPFLLAASLNLVIAQRLVKRLCSECQESYDAPADAEAMIKKELEGVDLKEQKINLQSPLKLYRGKGCPKCGRKGTKGRIAIYESFPVSEKIEAVITSGKGEQDLFKVASEEGMLTMKQDGVIKALQGFVSLEEVLRVVEE